MKLTFLGAARQVTGSMSLLEIEDEQGGNLNILVDCGTSMENDQEGNNQQFNFEENYSGQLFPFEASQIHAVILTHAHIDHSGQIPNLIREGFEGKIFCSEPTYYLAHLLLEDSASLNQRKVKKLYKKRKGKFKGDEISHKISRLYMPRHVEESMDFFAPVPCNKELPLNEQVSLKMIPTGHLLGACNVVLNVYEKGKKKSLCFSGDIGRYDYPLLKDPVAVPEVDYLISETTYGNRKHQSTGNAEDILYEVIHNACIEKGGRLIIPAFSVGRTQALLYTLNKLYEDNRLPPIKVFSDSPMAIRSTRIYERFYKELNQEAIDFMNDNKFLFDFENLEIIESSEQSRALSNYDQPCIIISSSGMISGGRIENHVYKNLQNKNSTLFFIGYCAEGTLGHKLVNGAETIQVKDNEIQVKCNIVQTDIFSGHGDINDLINFAKQQNPRTLKQFFLVHGDYEAMEYYKKELEQLDFKNITIPEHRDSYEF